MLRQRTSSLLLLQCLRDSITAAKDTGEVSIGFAAREIVNEQYVSNGAILFNKVVQKGYPISVMAFEMGIEVAIGYISVLITSLCNSFNVSRNMTAHQISEYSYNLFRLTAKSMDPNDPAYRLEDIALFVDQAKMGKYGKLYGGLDVTVLEEWRMKFDAERENSYSNWRISRVAEHNTIGGDPVTPPTDETMAKFRAKYEQLVKSLNAGNEDSADEEERKLQLSKKRVEEMRKRFWGENYKPLPEDEVGANSENLSADEER